MPVQHDLLQVLQVGVVDEGAQVRARGRRDCKEIREGQIAGGYWVFERIYKKMGFEDSFFLVEIELHCDCDWYTV